MSSFRRCPSWVLVPGKRQGFCGLQVIAAILVCLVQVAGARAWALDLKVGGALLIDRRSPSVLTLEDGRILVCGGKEANAPQWIGTCELWDPRTGETQEVMSLAQARLRPALATSWSMVAFWWSAAGMNDGRGITGSTEILDLRLQRSRDGSAH